jgi:hypothetical protein
LNGVLRRGGGAELRGLNGEDRNVALVLLALWEAK